MKLLIAHGLSPSIAERVRDVLTDHYPGIRWIVEDSSVGCVLDEPVDQCVLATVGYASLFLCGWFLRDVPTKTLPPLVPMSREERARRGLADARGDATPSPLVQAALDLVAGEAANREQLPVIRRRAELVTLAASLAQQMWAESTTESAVKAIPKNSVDTACEIQAELDRRFDQSDVPTVESAGPSEGERKRNP
jgi:hypothetical protein